MTRRELLKAISCGQVALPQFRGFLTRASIPTVGLVGEWPMHMPNLLRRSEDLTYTSGAWARTNMTPTIAAVSPPAEIPTAQVSLLTTDAVTGSHCVDQLLSGAAGNYIFRFWAKLLPGSSATKLYVYTLGGNQCWIELSGTPAVLTNSSNYLVVELADGGNGWTKVTVKAGSQTNGTGVIYLRIGMAAADNETSFLGDAGTGIYVTGVQAYFGWTLPAAYTRTVLPLVSDVSGRGGGDITIPTYARVSGAGADFSPAGAKLTGWTRPSPAYTVIQACQDEVQGYDSAGGEWRNGVAVAPGTLTKWDLTGGSNNFAKVLTYLAAYDRVIPAAQHLLWYRRIQAWMRAADHDAYRYIPRPCVTFTFDDAKDTAYSNMFTTAFAPRSLPAVSCCHSSGIGGVQTLTAANLRTMVEGGWEIVSHSVTHPSDMKTLTEAQLVTEFADSKAALEGYLSTAASGQKLVWNCAYPGGNANFLVRDVCRRYYGSGRSAAGNAANVFALGPYYTLIVSLDDHTQLAAWKAKVDTAYATSGWLIFLGHGQDAGSDTPAIAELLDYITGTYPTIPVKTIQQALTYMANPIL